MGGAAGEMQPVEEREDGICEKSKGAGPMPPCSFNIVNFVPNLFI